MISIQGGERASTSICLVKYWTLLLILGEREDASNLFNYGMMQDVNFHLVIERERERAHVSRVVLDGYLEMERQVV